MKGSSRATLACLALLAACARPSPAPLPPTPQAVAPSASAAPAAAEPFRAARPPSGAPGRFEYPTPEVTVLDNGLTLYRVRRPSRVVTLTLLVRHGAASDPENKSGLAALTARLLTEATKRKPSMALAEAVESLGASLGSAAGRDESSVELTVLPADVERGLSLLAEVVTEPAFTNADFERVRSEWLDNLRAERQSPQRLAMLAAVRTLHGPLLGSPVNGTIAGVEKLAVADLRAFHARAYTPDRAALVVVGDFAEPALSTSVARLFRPFRGKSQLPPPPAPASNAPPATRVLLVDRPGAVQSAIAVVQAFPKRSEPGHEARELLGRVLGGLFTSRLNTNLREKHAYTYGAFAQAVATRHTGTLLVSSNVRTDVTAPALDEIRRELQLMRDPKLGAPLTSAELERGRADLVFSLGATLEHPSRVADVIGDSFVEELPADYAARYGNIVAAVGAAEVNQAAQAITPERLLVVIVGDRAKVEPELRRRSYAVEAASDALLE